jgi:HSP20 family molecular chaperone IbpA
VIVEGRHEERDDGHGSVQRHFIRRYELPKEYDMSQVHSVLSSDGVLSIKAPLPAIKASGEKMVPIAHSSMPARLHMKDNGHAESPANAKSPH